MGIEHRLNDEYFNWMYQLVCNDKYNENLSYRRLLHYLHTIDFYYLIDMDENRADEGIIELEVVPNKEFYQRLLSFGSDVEVLEPQFVREEMTKNAQKIYELYKKR